VSLSGTRRGTGSDGFRCLSRSETGDTSFCGLAATAFSNPKALFYNRREYFCADSHMSFCVQVTFHEVGAEEGTFG